MMYMKLLFTLAFALSGLHGTNGLFKLPQQVVKRLSPLEPVGEGEGDPSSDKYIDEILANLREIIIQEEMDPSSLPDEEAHFSKHIMGITVHGSAKLYNGNFWGLATILRTGETSFTMEGSTVRLTAYWACLIQVPIMMPRLSSWVS